MERTSSGYDNNVYVKRYNGQDWELVAPPLSIPGYSPNDPSFVVCNGLPYIASDQTSSNRSLSYVHYFDGNNWQQLGSCLNYNPNPTQYNGALRPELINSGGKIYATWQEWMGNGEIFAKYYNGTDWQLMGSGSLKVNASYIYVYETRISAYQNIPYICWRESPGYNDPSEIYIKHFNGSDWVTDRDLVNENIVKLDYLAFLNMDVIGGIPCASWVQNPKIKMRYYPSSNWVSADDATSSSFINYKASASEGDVTYVAYSDNYNQIIVRKFIHNIPASPTWTATPAPSPSITENINSTVTSTPTPTSTQNKKIDLSGKQVLAYPNPARGVVHFAWAESNAEKVRIAIYNLTGERIVALTAATPGQSLDWNAAGVAPGIYIYRVALTVNGAEHQLPMQKLAIIKQ
jgi:hypothetical protein